MPEPSKDETLVRDIRNGSTKAFGELMSRYERLVYRVSYIYTRDRDDALDVTQNVFLKAYRGLDSYRGVGSFKAWLLRITHHENLNWIRESQKQSRGYEPHEIESTARSEIDIAAPSADPSPDTLLDIDDERRLLAKALVHLNTRQRQAVELRYFGGMSIREIAGALGCSEGVVKNILFRGLRKLRRELARQVGDDRG